MTNHIKKMLRIVEENLEVSSVTQELIKNKQTLVIHANLSHEPKPCTQCGSTPFDCKWETNSCKKWYQTFNGNIRKLSSYADCHTTKETKILL